MITLILDTSTSKSIVVFSENGVVIWKKYFPEGMLCSSYLMHVIEEGFKSLNLKPSNLDVIAIARGPGSYTGVRVGAAAAKGLAFPDSIPLIGFCSLEGYVSEEEGIFASLIDARIGGVYLLLQKRLEGQIILQSEPQFVLNDELELFLTGRPLPIGPHNAYPDCAYLASLVQKKWERGEVSRDIELLYLRSPSYRHPRLA